MQLLNPKSMLVLLLLVEVVFGLTVPKSFDGADFKASEHLSNVELNKEGKKLIHDIGLYNHQKDQGGRTSDNEIISQSAEVNVKSSEQVDQTRNKRETPPEGQFGVTLWETITHHTWTIALGAISLICIVGAVAVLACKHKRTEYTEV
ncbi:unnamed protein product [Allacma fusca]|uniref:Uncharacterized protein n=1 Tax=Allacma fusca TaxID=39272 RepID=A0A8J2JP30_9HEXA|nr:unnamed protein product [Allacma fusca]